MVPQKQLRILLSPLRALRDLRGTKSLGFTTKGKKNTKEGMAG